MISPETIAQVRERTDIVALIGETVRLTRRGRSFVGLCPFHKEKSPSFHVSPERGFYHCFGCKESGSPIDFAMKTLGLTFPEAVRTLAERAGVAIAEHTTDAAQREANAARRAKEDLYAVNHLAATFFEQSLRGDHPFARLALDELERRGLPLGPATEDGGAMDPVTDALQAFRIGYAPFGWDGLATYLRKQGISPTVAEKIGLLVPRSSGGGYYDRFRHRLMFAVMDVMGRVVAFSGRALPDPEPDAIARYAPDLARSSSSQPQAAPAKYINSPESPIYTKGEHLFGLHQARQAIRQQGEVVLVEGNFDVVALHARGHRNVVAPLGTAFTTQQAKLLKRFAPAVVLLFDGDAAGRKATRAARGPCREGGLSAKVAALPAGLDPDDLARQRGPEAIARLVKGAVGLLEFLLDDALDDRGFRGASLEEQLARVRAVMKLLGEEDDPNLRAMAKLYADKLAAKLLVGDRTPMDLRELERLVEQSVSRPERGAPRGDASPVASPEQGPRARSRAMGDEMSLQILGALIDVPQLFRDPAVEAALSVLDGDTALAAYAMRRAGCDETSLHGDEFLALLPRSIHAFAAGRLALPLFETAAEAKGELLENARKLKRLTLSRENAASMERLHRADVQGDVAQEDALLREFARRAREKLGLG